jgi:hypothetical protein
VSADPLADALRDAFWNEGAWHEAALGRRRPRPRPASTGARPRGAATGSAPPTSPCSGEGMSGLLDAVERVIHDAQCPVGETFGGNGCALLADGEPNKAMRNHIDRFEAEASAAVEAVAAWLEAHPERWVRAAAALRSEVAPPKPTPEDVIRSMCAVCRRWDEPCEVCKATVAALRDAGLLKEES